MRGRLREVLVVSWSPRKSFANPCNAFHDDPQKFDSVALLLPRFELVVRSCGRCPSRELALEDCRLCSGELARTWEDDLLAGLLKVLSSMSLRPEMRRGARGRRVDEGVELIREVLIAGQRCEQQLNERAIMSLGPTLTEIDVGKAEEPTSPAFSVLLSGMSTC